jgi:hypothetical protein
MGRAAKRLCAIRQRSVRALPPCRPGCFSPRCLLRFTPTLRWEDVQPGCARNFGATTQEPQLHCIARMLPRPRHPPPPTPLPTCAPRWFKRRLLQGTTELPDARVLFPAAGFTWEPGRGTRLGSCSRATEARPKLTEQSWKKEEPGHAFGKGDNAT